MSTEATGQIQKATFERLLIEQRSVIDQLGRVVPNYKKLGKEKFTEVKTRNRIQTLRELWTSCKALHCQIQTSATGADHKHEYFQHREFLSAEADFEGALDYLTELLDRQERDANPVASNQDVTALVGQQQASSTFALPRITIPAFTGESTKWESFRDSFTALVGLNSALTAAQKLYYLKSFLDGEAALLIQNIQVSDANYQGAWQLLIDEYDNPRALVFAHIHAFASLPVMKLESAAELKVLRDTVSASLAALRQLKRPVEHWDDLLVYIVTQKFSTRTRTEWNLRLGASNEYPSFSTLKNFLTERIRGITESNYSEDASTSTRAGSNGSRVKARATVHNATMRQCPCCKGNHFLTFCPAFRRKQIDSRYQIAKDARVCFNCLKQGHFPSQCPSERTCTKCQRTHHTLLHRDSRESDGPQSDATRDGSPSSNSHPAAINAVTSSHPPRKTSPTSSMANKRRNDPAYVLLATAWVNLRTAEGRVVKARALLDQGSAFSFISETLAQLLRPSRHRADLHITVFGEAYEGTAKSKAYLQLESRYRPGASLPMVAYIYQKISAYAAERYRSLGAWDHLRNLELADPDPSSQETIDVLIGADLYGTLLLGPLRKGPFGSPTAQLTMLGWIVSGPRGTKAGSPEDWSALHCVHSSRLDELIRKFWEIEEVPGGPFLTPDEEKCESHFRLTHSRNAAGRYIVRLPFHEERPPILGDSYDYAVLRLTRDERRLAKNPELSAEYTNFLAEYESLGHMERVSNLDSHVHPVYIPHHPVLREDHVTTKLRVVFNASSVTKDGTSLNDHLLVGPKLQRDIASIILNWRQHRYVLTTDIEKMFRQILVHPDDTHFQSIVWRPDRGGPIESYRLLTVTYGTACAPYLAMRVLLQLADDEGEPFPEAAAIVRSSCYVDDILFGHNDLDQAIKIRDQLIELLQRGGFCLRKWAANNPELLQNLPSGESTLVSHALDDSSTHKVLGLSWVPVEDCFRFQVTEQVPTAPTKRAILSFIARLFDPLGWASPVIISAKLLLQDLWLQQLEWDDPVPEPFLHTWQEFYYNFPRLSEVRIPRWTGLVDCNPVVEIHGFSDASQRAYSAVVYLRVLRSPDDVSVTLLAAKSKVAPLKTVAIPRLELNGAVLLVRLLEHVQKTMKYDSVPMHGWTDSAVVLAWLARHPSHWTQYVANRVSEIQTKLPRLKWHHVPSQSNPADCASRGVTVADFLRHPLWWSGPTWLRKPSVCWPPDRGDTNNRDSLFFETVNREQRASTVAHATTSPETWDLVSRYSSWGKLLRVTAHVQRFVELLRSRVRRETDAVPAFGAAIIGRARKFWLKEAQRSQFGAEIRALENRVPLPRSSPLLSLNPFLDGDGLLRLGGRLRHAFISYDERFPILLPRHPLSTLIIDQAHSRSLHGGPQLTLRILRQNFWILGARTLVKGRLKRCLTCARERATTASQLMGDLPSARVNPSPPFAHSGVDYAGPFHVTPRPGRGQRARKCYVALFVCLASRAIHLEFVEDYSTAGFIAGFRRFVSRRGLPSDVYSDNGTNFIGANRELRHAFLATTKDPILHGFLVDQGVTWHFIPASAPHFGGLWEAGVKSFKHHFNRVVGNRTLSQLEFTTLLCQIEACLNSRPLTALSSDANTFEALTPGHFLIGRPLLSIAEPSLLDVPDNRLTRWQRIQSLRDHIWRAWSNDYLHSLHQRAKWRSVEPGIKVDDLVLLKHPHLPPGKWEKARVVTVHPGADGLIRVVTVRTAKATLKRPIAKICPLIAADS